MLTSIMARLMTIHASLHPLMILTILSSTEPSSSNLMSRKMEGAPRCTSSSEISEGYTEGHALAFVMRRSVLEKLQGLYFLMFLTLSYHSPQLSALYLSRYFLEISCASCRKGSSEGGSITSIPNFFRSSRRLPSRSF